MRVEAAFSFENAFWTAIAAALDAHTTPGRARVYSGTPPARGGALTGGNVLVVDFTLADPCAASISDGVLTLGAVAPALVLSTAAHTFARFESGAGTWVMDIDSGILGSGAAWEFNASSFAVGALILPDSLTFYFD